MIFGIIYVIGFIVALVVVVVLKTIDNGYIDITDIIDILFISLFWFIALPIIATYRITLFFIHKLRRSK